MSAAVVIPCQSDAACGVEQDTLVWAYSATEVGIDGILTCSQHVIAARKTLGRRTSAVIFTTPTNGAPA